MSFSLEDSSLFLADHGEEITYIPYSALDVTITAVIERNPVSQIQNVGGRSFPAKIIELWIANDETVGRAEIKERFDKVSVPGRLDSGREAVEYLITRIIDHDDTLWHLEAQA